MRFPALSFMVLFLITPFVQAQEKEKAEDELWFEGVFESLQPGNELSQSKEILKVARLIVFISKGKTPTDDDKLFLTVIDGKYNVGRNKELFSALTKREMDLDSQIILLRLLERVVQRQKETVERHISLLEQLDEKVEKSKHPPEWVWSYLGEMRSFYKTRKDFADYLKALQDSIKKLQG